MPSADGPIDPKLFTPTSLGDLKLTNRIVYPAMTRARAPGNIVNDEMVKYYKARATAGMIVSEPSFVSDQAIGYNDTPGLYSEAQASAWSRVTEAVHAEGCTIVAQLWHTGRMSHSTFHGGAQILAPSAVKIEDVNGIPACGVQGADGEWHAHETPRAMTTAEVQEVVASFGKAAALAKTAGFDGIEVHAGSGYLVDTFLQACSNTREDKYGGSAEKRFTFLAEVLDAVSASFPLSRVGVKLSPNNGFNGMGALETFATFTHAATRLKALGVAYLHVVDGVGHSSSPTWYGRVDSSGFHGCSMPVTLASLKEAFGPNLIGNGGYSAETAGARVAAGDAAAISFGRMYMTNPDLVRRFREALPLAPLPPKSAWFEPTEATRADLSKGYTEFGPHVDAPKRPTADATKTTVLHLLGSPTSTYYEELSLMYASGCASANDDGEYYFVYAMVHPGSLMSFPADLSAETREATPKMPVAQGVARLAALGADVCVPHMFCYDGMTSYRALLELLDVPFVGCDSASMALSTNKSRAKAVMAAAGTPVPRGELLRAGERPSLAFPIIVKPCSEDNSMGVSLCRTEEEVDAALAGALAFDDEVLVEEFIPLGRELRVGVVAEPRADGADAGAGGDDDAPARLRVLPTLEYHLPAEKPIRASNDKLTSDKNGVMSGFAKTSRTCPADVDEALWARVEAGAKRAHVALGCRDYSLYDVRVAPDGTVAFLEACLYCSFAPRSVIVLMAGATAEPAIAHVPLFVELVERASRRKRQQPAAAGDGAAAAAAPQFLGMKAKPAAKARAVTFDQPVTVAA